MGPQYKTHVPFLVALIAVVILLQVLSYRLTKAKEHFHTDGRFILEHVDPRFGHGGLLIPIVRMDPGTVQGSTPQQPVFQQPAFQQPAFQQPAFQQPAFQQPAFQQPAFQEPVFQQPAFQQPAFQQPVFQQPALQPLYQSAPSFQQPTAAVQKPAPEAKKPAPEAKKPAPAAQKPAPAVQKPAPEAKKPAPAAQKPAPAAQVEPQKPQEPAVIGEALPSQGITYMGNDVLQIGMDMDSGGSIVHISCHGAIANPAYKDRNLLNTFDKGRMLQQSYYGTEDGSTWMGRPWHWNPVQGGGFGGQSSPIKSANKEGSTCAAVTTTPRHWATEALIKEVEMVQKACLKGDHLNVHYTMAYSGTTSHPQMNQEMPAFFTLRKFSTLCFYQGTKPWSNDALTIFAPTPESAPQGNNMKEGLSESWAAYIDPDTNWGIGMYFPHTTKIVYYTFEGGGDFSDPKGLSCSYFAPVVVDAITPNKTFDYNVYITMGSAEQIRASFKKIKDSQK